MYEHSQVLRYVRTHQIRHRAVVGFSSGRKSAISQCLLCYSLHIACFSASLLLSLSLLPSWSIHREKCSTLPPFQWFHPAFAPVSMFTISCDFCLFETAARFNSCAIPGTSCCGVRDPWSVEYQSCELAMFLQHRSRDWLRSDISTNFRCEHHLDTKIFILNSFLYTNASCIDVFPSWSCSQPNRQRVRCGTVIWISTFIRIPRSMYIDLKDSPT